MSNESLYNLSANLEYKLACLVNQETGEVDEQTQLAINELLPSIKEKCLAVSNYIRKLKADKMEVFVLFEELSERLSNYDAKIKSMEDYLKMGMEKSDLTEVSCPEFTIKIKKNPFSTEIIDESLIPKCFIRTKEIIKIEEKPDKTAIKEFVLTSGKQVPGAYVKQDTKLIITNQL